MKLLFLSSTVKKRDLIGQLIKRDIVARYKGSILGISWSMINPLIMISIYTLVFSQIFQAKWGTNANNSDPLYFGINLFCGLVVFNMFAESATRSPTLITSNPNYVKKIIFPLYTLGEMVIGGTLVHATISTTILITTKVLIMGKIGANIILLPIAWLPFILQCLGMVWLLCTVGVFIKDTGQIINAFVSMTMFLSPIFYPSSAIPDDIKWLIGLNPLVKTIENTRLIIMENGSPEIISLVVQIIIGIAWCEINYRILRNASKYFGDVL